MRAVFLVLFVLVLLVAVYIWSGAYNIAAVEPHSTAVAWLLETFRDRSIARHSEDVQPPPLADPDLTQAGLQHYHAMCVVCHGAPGQEPSEIGQGLNPAPPKLDAEAVQARSDAQLYWIIKNGIKMTGMPAFGKTHGERELWALVAFLRRLPGMEPQEYSAMVEAAGLQREPSGHSHAPAPGQAEKAGAAPHTHEHEHPQGEGTHPHAHGSGHEHEGSADVPRQ